MAIRFITEIVLHWLQHVINFVFGVDSQSFLEILLFELVMEILNYFILEPQLSSPSETEPLAPLEQLPTNNGNNETPVVRLIMIYRICQTLDLSVEFAPFEETDPFQTPSRNLRKITPLPVIYSSTIFEICEALDLKAELRPEIERPTIVLKKKEVVHSSCSLSCNVFHLSGIGTSSTAGRILKSPKTYRGQTNLKEHKKKIYWLSNPTKTKTTK
ncbi:hypothetical protein NPIL_622351 [Nephila pilipes]|uniref:Uncharacterized protein n=1 Tax=Nephila pilipes TaxID=299642 RepID=A0A8X6MRW7_NEPPI|nr:hypothetical protein NPIL_622351 [Nephila pilipes]